MLEWLLYQVPWWVWAIIAAVIYAAALFVAAMVFGWQRVRPFALPILIVLGAVAALGRARQQGWQDKVKKDLKATDRFIERATRTREKKEAEMRDNPDKVIEDDGFRRD